MFAIGEVKSEVYGSKLRLPKEYNLKRKDRRIYGVWDGKWLLYLSDEIAPLKSKGGKNGMIFTPHIDSEYRIAVPAYLEKKESKIKGCISTIEIRFIKEKEYE